MLKRLPFLFSRPSKSYLTLNCHQNKNLENQESILCGGFVLAKSNFVNTL
ncbi:MAG: hypothetical protein RIQ33_413 [Bacteroidota bacterium]|jgi:hypothetical protein